MDQIKANHRKLQKFVEKINSYSNVTDLFETKLEMSKTRYSMKASTGKISKKSKLDEFRSVDPSR